MLWFSSGSVSVSNLRKIPPVVFQYFTAFGGKIYSIKVFTYNFVSLQCFWLKLGLSEVVALILISTTVHTAVTAVITHGYIFF